MLSTPNGEDDGVLDDSGIIARPRLLSKLQGAETHKLTLISAPPGYGKTTLASQFVRQTRYPVLWYSVEERDRDVPTLYTRCLTLLERVTPGTAQLPLPYGFTANDLATAVGNFLHQNLNVPILLVLDDVHHLTGSSDAEAWLRVFVLAAPPNCHFILMSRTLPDLPLVEMIARREVLAIGQEELRLTPYEIEALARRLPTSQTPGAIDELTERLEGWPAGTVLALYPLPPEFERAILQGRQGPEALFDSLAAVMLDSQPERMRSFLLASSTLRRMTPELCEQALTLPDAATLIREAQARNLFLSRTTGGLVYHALFRRFLQHYLETTDPRRYADFHAHAARWFEQHNVPDDAFNHYYSARFYTEAAHVADQMAQAYFVQGKVETLLTWESMLRETDAPSGRLLYSCALIHTDRYEFDRAEEALERIPLVAKDSGAEGAAAVGEVDIRLQRAMIQFRRGNYEVAAAQAGALLKELPDTIEANNARRRALDTLGTAQLNLGEVESARRCLEEAVPLYRTNADAHALSQVLQNLGVVYLRLGRLTDASATLQEVVAIRRALGGTSSLALALNNLAYYYHQCNDYRQALITLKEGLSIVSRFPSKRTESYLLWSLGDVQRDRGLAPTALEHYQKALDLVGQHEPPLRCGVLTSRAMLYRWQGDLGEALRGANEASELALLHDLPIEHNVAQAVVHIVRVENGESEQGLYNLEQIARNLETAEAHFELVRILAFSARAAQPFNPDLAKNYLRRAFQQGEKVGSTRELIIELANSPSLEALVRRDSSRFESLIHDLEVLREVRRRAQADLPETNKRLSLATYSLRVFTLGQDTIIRDGKPVPASDWRASTAKELFLYLMFNGPCSRDQLSLTFWRDASTQRARSSFHTTLYRARQALGDGAITLQDGMYAINPDIDVWCDANELETLAIQARLLSPHDARTEDLWRRAVDLYQGDFLPALDSEWSMAWREASYERYIEALMGLGTCARARRDFRKALEIFRRALAVEPYREDIHRAIMICYAQQGERQRLEKHMHDLRLLLRHDLDCEPSVETISLVRSLLN